jgi:hypothetical protein
MRTSDLIDKTVHDAGGEEVGHVADVRLVRDGPPVGADAAFRVHGLVVVSHGVGSYLGYERSAVSRPGVFNRLLRWAHRNARYVTWSEVASVDPDGIRLSVRRSDLPGVPELT